MHFADPRITELRMRGIPFRPLLDSPELRKRLAEAGAAPATRPPRNLLEFAAQAGRPCPRKDVVVTGASRARRGLLDFEKTDAPPWFSAGTGGLVHVAAPIGAVSSQSAGAAQTQSRSRLEKALSPPGPSLPGAVAGTIVGTGMPVLPKEDSSGKIRSRKTFGSQTPGTSLSSKTAQHSFLSNVKIPQTRTPTIGSRTAKAGNLGVLVGRGAPLAGPLLAAADIAFSDDPWRTAAGNTFGLIGGGVGAAALAPSGVGIIGGGLAGSYIGNQFGLALYDNLFGDLRAAEDPNNYAPPRPHFGFGIE